MGQLLYSLYTSLLRAAFIILSCLCLQSCNSAENFAEQRASSAEGEDVSLAILGYNYTDHRIGQFTVNDNGGDRVELSTPNSGGTGTTCCVRFNPGLRNFSVMVRWTDTQCIYKVRSKFEGEFDEIFIFTRR